MADFGPLDELMGTLLETWDQRYTFKFDRVARRIVFTRPGVTVIAEETEDGRIRVSLQIDGTTYVREGGPLDSATAIEGTLFPAPESDEPDPPAAEPALPPRRPWWRFWK